MVQPWDIVLYDPPEPRDSPIFFLSRCPAGVRAKLIATLTAVAEAPPPQFSGGGQWEAMGGNFAHIFGPLEFYRLALFHCRTPGALQGEAIDVDVLGGHTGVSYVAFDEVGHTRRSADIDFALFDIRHQLVQVLG